MLEETLKLVQNIYIAYYGRPADSGGLSYWANRIDTEGLGLIIEEFATSAESVILYGDLATSDRIAIIYQQLFNREPDAECLAFYTARIDTLPMTGSLMLGENIVVVDQEIAAAAIENLVYTPATHASGDFSFTYSLSDGTAFSATATATVTVNSTSLQFNSAATASIAENSSAVVRDIEASLNGGAADAGIRYSLTGGADQALFTINENNGELSFIDVPDFENPLDADTDNIYQATVTATATAGVETTRQNLTVTVTNENDAPTSSSSPTDDASAATARNFESGDASGPDTSTVVFDLTSGLSSDHSSQTFSPNITYSLYIKVDSDSNAVSLNADEGWSGANHLGSDDQMILVGDGAAILGRDGNAIIRNGYSTSGAYGWFTENDAAAALTAGGEFNRVFAAEQNSVDLWDGMPLPDAEADLLSLSHLTALPDSVSLPIL